MLAESKYPGCTRLADIMEDLSDDSLNRFLLRQRYEPKDLFDEVSPYINLIGGTLSGDDTDIDKPPIGELNVTTEPLNKCVVLVDLW